MQTSLKGINNRATLDASHRFGGLYRLLNTDNLRWAYKHLNKKASSGVDRVTHSEYGQNLEENLNDLVDRLKKKNYKAKLIRRVHIPKSATKTRPLGIPTLEDKILQLACSRILEGIYEADFIKHSYGYRRGQSAHDAVKTVAQRAQFDPYHYVVEADIKGFFDNIDHDWLLRMIELRVDDCAFVSLIKKWLKAGIMEKDKVTHPDTGTPQGGVISPVLANIYLHYALDIWFKKRVSKLCSGKCEIVRYADDFVCLFQRKVDAEAFYQQLPERLKKFNLEVAPEKTNLLCFSRYATAERNETFAFVGFEFRRETSRRGKPLVTTKTDPKKLQKKRAEFKEWIEKNRSLKLWKIMASVRRKLIGHYNYYGVIGNSKRMTKYYYWSQQNLFKWLNRRSQRKSFNWTEFNKMLKRYNIPTPKITHGQKTEKRQGSRQELFSFM